jgi:nitrate reductase alpha subunit
MVRFRSKSDAPDLHTQLESMLDQVWRSEADWRLWDRLDAAVKLEDLRKKHLGGEHDVKKAA